MPPLPTLPRRLLRCAIVLTAAAMLTTSVRAAFHLWNIREIYTDSSGSLQFIEFFTTDFSQQFVGGQQIQVSNVGSTLTHSFTIPSNLPGDSANRAFLIGTAGIDAAGGPAPDYIIPDNFLFIGGGSIAFFGLNGGAYTALPTDGILSRLWGNGNVMNNPQNFAGQTGSVVPEPTTWALVGVAAAGLYLLRRRRV